MMSIYKKKKSEKVKSEREATCASVTWTAFEWIYSNPAFEEVRLPLISYIATGLSLSSRCLFAVHDIPAER
jgi:hypothetical protein